MVHETKHGIEKPDPEQADRRYGHHQRRRERASKKGAAKNRTIDQDREKQRNDDGQRRADRNEEQGVVKQSTVVRKPNVLLWREQVPLVEADVETISNRVKQEISEENQPGCDERNRSENPLLSRKPRHRFPPVADRLRDLTGRCHDVPPIARETGRSSPPGPPDTHSYPFAMMSLTSCSAFLSASSTFSWPIMAAMAWLPSRVCNSSIVGTLVGQNFA